MYRPFIFIFSLLALGILYSQNGNRRAVYMEEYRRLDKIYHEAEQLSLRSDYSEATEAIEIEWNQQVLKGLKQLTPVVVLDRNDSLAFHCYFRIATLEHYFDSLPDAKLAYRKAIGLGTRSGRIRDSFLFKPFLYYGNILYSFNQFDSAFYFYKQAENISDRYAGMLQGVNRLYNAIGALYYETGNFRQARNYFEKAIFILSPSDPSFEDLRINYQINLASTLNKLESYDEADSIYQQLLPLNINRNEILHNMGTIKLNTGAIQQALAYFKQVNYSNNRIIRLYNDLGYTYSNLGKKDSAFHYYRKASEQNAKWNGEQKNSAFGQTLKFAADEWAADGNYEKAVHYYQQAIVQFDNDFNNLELTANPEEFRGVFSYIQLFHTLIGKGDALNSWYSKSRNSTHLKASLDAYRAGYKLADYVERIYDSDEARLFLNKIKHTVHSKPIDVSLDLYDATGDKSYLETAYQFDQQNKASVLSLNLSENKSRDDDNEAGALLGEEATLRSTITRLSLKASQSTDTALISSLRSTIRDYEIHLGKLQEKLNNDPEWQRKNLVQRIPTIKELQRKLDNETALISYHMAENYVLLLLITKNKFRYYRSPIDSMFLNTVHSAKLALSNISGPGKDSSVGSRVLYRTLITPIETEITQTGRLIIIPDDDLHYLPFEALEKMPGNYLLEQFSIQYQYSTALLDMEENGINNANTLALAPFSQKEFLDTMGNTLLRLPSSKEEVSNLSGSILLDSNATKQNFLQMSPSYGILHLATHASANNNDPPRSFIAFYPTPGEEYKLYAQEIYDLDLDSTKLVILSACETGAGALIKGEGIMSLSRAFAYAGCPNIITSLWKAEDKTTAYIMRRLHQYLGNGYTKDRALQLAKLDLLKNTSIDPRFKSPSSWAHLVFIGQYEPIRNSHSWWWIAVGVLIFGIITWIVKSRKKL